MRIVLVLLLVAASPVRAEDTREGATVEMSVGPGAQYGDGDASIVRGAGLDIGYGIFVHPRVALSLRISGVAGDRVGGSENLSYLGVVGPNLQVWPDERVWIGGGIGVAPEADSPGCDLRAGYSLVSTPFKSLGISIEMTVAKTDTSWRSSLSLLFGYQTF